MREMEDTEQLNKVWLVLLATVLGSLLLAVVLVCLFETDLLPTGELAGVNIQAEFMVTTVMELLTIAVIPLALKLFKFPKVHASLIQNTTEALLPW